MFLVADARAVQKNLDGIGRYAVNALRTLTEIRPDWKISVIIGRDGACHLKEISVDCIISDVPRFRWGENTNLVSLIDSLGADVYLNFSMGGPTPSIPFIVTIHDLMVLELPDYFGSNFLRNSISRRIFKSLITKSLKSASAISVPTEFTAKRLKTVFSGLSFKTFITGEGQNLFSEKSDTKGDYLLYVGNARSYKNLPRLLIAYSRLYAMNRYFPKLIMVVSKDRAYKPFLRTLHDCSAFDVIEVRNNIDEDELIELYRNCMALIMPSIMEGFGLPALEAMAAGKPVIVSKETALEEITGDAAYLIDPYSVTDIMKGMAEIAVDDDLRHNLGEKSYIQSQNYTWEKTTQIIAEKLEELV